MGCWGVLCNILNHRFPFVIFYNYSMLLSTHIFVFPNIILPYILSYKDNQYLTIDEVCTAVSEGVRKSKN